MSQLVCEVQNRKGTESGLVMTQIVLMIMIHGYDTDNADDKDNEDNDDLESRPRCAGGFREAR